jgi:hypothetical protein
MGSGLEFSHSILSPEWNADKTRVDKGSLLDCGRTPVPGDRCAGRSLWGGGWICGSWIWS